MIRSEISYNTVRIPIGQSESLDEAVMVKKAKLKPFIGQWLIDEMETWDQEYVNMETRGHFTLKKHGIGHFQFGLVQGEMDCRVELVDGKERIEFSWQGQDEMDPASGRGWAVIENGQLLGRIFIHMGDDSAFRAERR